MKNLLLSLVSLLFTNGLLAQTTTISAQKKLTDVICSCLGETDLDKITSKQAAIDVFTNCFTKRTDLLMQVATERHIEITDDAAMEKIGTDIGKDLLAQNCAAFLKVSVKMVQSEKNNQGTGSTTGTFKRIDNKGFNYIVITENGNEKSFLWLTQFAGSEKFMDNTTSLTGKNLNVSWKEIEVYLPQAKGYYKVKEITEIDF